MTFGNCRNLNSIINYKIIMSVFLWIVIPRMQCNNPVVLISRLQLDVFYKYFNFSIWFYRRFKSLCQIVSCSGIIIKLFIILNAFSTIISTHLEFFDLIYLNLRFPIFCLRECLLPWQVFLCLRNCRLISTKTCSNLWKI